MATIEFHCKYCGHNTNPMPLIDPRRKDSWVDWWLKHQDDGDHNCRGEGRELGVWSACIDLSTVDV